VLLPALKSVRPTIMLTVPLIIEKIHKKQVVPAFEKSAFMKSLYRMPFFRKRLNRLAGKKLMKTFGGRLRFFGVGGAKLNKSVEQFLLEARFPYAVGYGLTETSPLIAGFGPTNQRLQSTGPPIEGIEVKIHQPDPETGEGEIWVRGPNVMKGYYKEPEMTREVLTEDGWFRTGDLGVFDKDNYLYIKGRIKNVIIGPGGENIYPEDIESVINSLWYVDESLVVEEEGKLVAFVRVNLEEVEKKLNDLKESASDFYEKNVDTLLKELKDYVNRKVNRFSRIQDVKIQEEPFIKTATNKIKRFLYHGGDSKKGSMSKNPG
jgi:long-chain acyl-CoA synthetase